MVVFRGGFPYPDQYQQQLNEIREGLKRADDMASPERRELAAKVSP